ncbi:MAG: DNA polymerase III subunit delta [Chthoniobacterales bacterium]|nr:DNA polymerase III subunit delta [Chthoniobacterales bacterium]
MKKIAAATAQIHAVIGSDESEVKRIAAELAAKLTPPDAGDFGIEIIDGCGDNAEQTASRVRAAVEALRTLPFFGGKLVWLKSANCLGDTVIGRSASVQSALEELGDVIAEDLPQDVTFLISATEVDKRRSFYKALSKRAELQVIDKLDASRSGWEEEATEIVRRRAKARGLQFQEEAIDLFVLLTGGDTRQIENELEKIDLYVGEERSVTADEVRTLVPLSRAGVIFELGNALAACDLQRALSLVKSLLDQGETAIGILLVAILPTVRNLLLAKDLMERHRLSRPSAPFSFISAINRLPADATAHLPRKKDGSLNTYALGIAAMSAHRFNTNQLIAGLEACLEANVQLVSSQLDHELILTEIVVKLLACATLHRCRRPDSARSARCMGYPIGRR